MICFKACYTCPSATKLVKEFRFLALEFSKSKELLPSKLDLRNQLINLGSVCVIYAEYLIDFFCYLKKARFKMLLGGVLCYEFKFELMILSKSVRAVIECKGREALLKS